jgi:phage terminase large subunit-like protein
VLRGTNRILKRADPDSFYAAIAADGDLGDGVNPAVVIADELHRWKTRKQLENWDVLSNGGITRRQTLTIGITTAGVQSESPLAWRLHEKTKKIREGIVADPKFYGRIYAAAPEDNPAAEATWIKAMPSLKENGGFLELAKMREKFTAHQTEGDLTSWKRYFLNLWDQKESRAIDLADWDRNAGDWQSIGLMSKAAPLVIRGRTIERKVRPYPDAFMKRFVDRRCWAGVDLSMTTDMSAAVFVFPSESNDRCDILPFFWLPDARIRKMEVTLGVPLRHWADTGFLELSAGNVIDYRDVRARLEWGAGMFDLEEICWDPWNSHQISVEMVDAGYRSVDIRQGYQSLSEAAKKILEFVAEGKLHHGGHPIMRWQASSVTTATDGKDNLMFVKPDRTKTTARVDGFSALANAMNRVIAAGKSKPAYQAIFF